jgi:hypothetical protein
MNGAAVMWTDWRMGKKERMVKEREIYEREREIKTIRMTCV